LKDFGLEKIYASRRKNQEISVGTYFYQVNPLRKYALADGMEVEAFLKLDPKLDTFFVIDNLFENRYTDEVSEFEKKDSDYNYSYRSDHNDDIDWEREAFDAMTDGQLGDYDDFNGDLDDVRTWSGRD